jgi:formate dehydrogenase subunit delta
VRSAVAAGPLGLAGAAGRVSSVAAGVAHPGGGAGAHKMEPARVARLLNDIAVQFPHLTDPEAVAAIAAHVQRFWEPRMLTELSALAGQPDTGLVPRAEAAARLVAG